MAVHDSSFSSVFFFVGNYRRWSLSSCSNFVLIIGIENIDLSINCFNVFQNIPLINLAKEDVVFVKNIFKLLIFEREDLRELYDVVIIILVSIILMKEIILNLLNVSMKICI